MNYLETMKSLCTVRLAPFENLYYPMISLVSAPTHLRKVFSLDILNEALRLVQERFFLHFIRSSLT